MASRTAASLRTAKTKVVRCTRVSYAKPSCVPARGPWNVAAVPSTASRRRRYRRGHAFAIRASASRSNRGTTRRNNNIPITQQTPNNSVMAINHHPINPSILLDTRTVRCRRVPIRRIASSGSAIYRRGCLSSRRRFAIRSCRSCRFRRT
uniref:(northern house mosquito) hypothetical protein n=1 Tax=Culex pipiens TaxID=7175 RepID=A0A8D8CY66_CULPI